MNAYVILINEQVEDSNKQRIEKQAWQTASYAIAHCKELAEEAREVFDSDHYEQVGVQEIRDSGILVGYSFKAFDGEVEFRATVTEVNLN